jgi:hypothetical protein
MNTDKRGLKNNSLSALIRVYPRLQVGFSAFFYPMFDMSPESTG